MLLTKTAADIKAGFTEAISMPVKQAMIMGVLAVIMALIAIVIAVKR